MRFMLRDLVLFKVSLRH